MIIDVVKRFFFLYINYEDFSKRMFFLFFVLIPWTISYCIVYLLPKWVGHIIGDNISNFITVFSILFWLITTTLSIMLTWYHINFQKEENLKKKLWYSNPKKIISVIKEIFLYNTYISLILILLASVLLILSYGTTNHQNISHIVQSFGWYFFLIVLYVLFRNFNSFLSFHNKIESLDIEN